MAHLYGPYGAALFCVLFVVVSFPMMWGYIILNLGAGYIYGFVVGSAITSVGANLGALVSFLVCRLLWKDYVIRKLSSYENLRQIVRVIEGRQGFRIIMMTRLTPVPFGLQNALFSVFTLNYGFHAIIFLGSPSHDTLDSKSVENALLYCNVYWSSSHAGSSHPPFFPTYLSHPYLYL